MWVFGTRSRRPSLERGKVESSPYGTTVFAKAGSRTSVIRPGRIPSESKVERSPGILNENNAVHHAVMEVTIGKFRYVAVDDEREGPLLALKQKIRLYIVKGAGEDEDRVIVPGAGLDWMGNPVVFFRRREIVGA